MKKLIAILLACAMLCTLTACSATDYKNATQLYESGDYEAASAAYKALGDYKDSAALAKACDYAIAQQLLEDGDYAAAAAAFDALGDYEDSADMAKESRYQQAVALLKEEKYEEAIALFTELSGYKSSDDYADEAAQALTRMKIIGTWITGELDYTDAFMQGVDLGGGDEAEQMKQYIQFRPFMVRYELTINEDDTAVFAVDKDSYEKAIDQVIEDLASGVPAYMEAYFTDYFSDYGYTMEQVYAAYGVKDFNEFFKSATELTLDEYLNEVMPREELIGLMDTMSVSGTYTLEGSTISFSGLEAVYDAAGNQITVSDDDLGELTFIRK